MTGFLMKIINRSLYKANPKLNAKNQIIAHVKMKFFNVVEKWG